MPTVIQLVSVFQTEFARCGSEYPIKLASSIRTGCCRVSGRTPALRTAPAGIDQKPIPTAFEHASKRRCMPVLQWVDLAIQYAVERNHQGAVQSEGDAQAD
jgi:hypothetical protein